MDYVGSAESKNEAKEVDLVFVKSVCLLKVMGTISFPLKNINDIRILFHFLIFEH